MNLSEVIQEKQKRIVSKFIVWRDITFLVLFWTFSFFLFLLAYGSTFFVLSHLLVSISVEQALIICQRILYRLYFLFSHQLFQKTVVVFLIQNALTKLAFSIVELFLKLLSCNLFLLFCLSLFFKLAFQSAVFCLFLPLKLPFCFVLGTESVFFVQILAHRVVLLKEDFLLLINRC